MEQQYRKKLWLTGQLMMAFALLGLLVSACSLPGSSSPSAGVTPTVSSHPVGSKPPATGKLPTGSQLPANQIKPLTFNLTYNDTAFDRDVAQIYTPGSPTFHKFLTSDQITQQYAVSDAQQQQVIDWLTKNGFTIDATDKLHTSIKVHGTVATIERALHITLKSYTFAGRTFFMQEGTPTIADPAGAFVSSVTGLDNFAFPQFKPPVELLERGQTSALSGNCANYGAKQNLTRDKLAAAYQINQLYQQGFRGQGMTIGVVEFGDGYDPHDLANYAACVGIGTPTVQNIDVNGHPSSGAGQGEAIVDLELIAGLAPQATILDYQTDGNTAFAQDLVDVFNRVASDHKVQVLSVSYGSYESAFSDAEMAAVNKSLRILSAEGISVFVASGDCGAYTQRLPHIAQVAFPASAIYSIAVGGTHLQVNNSNVRTSETAWGAGDNLPVCANDWGSGGGVSQNINFRRPSWQVGPGTTTPYDGASDHVFIRPLDFADTVSAPNGLRQVPDVAAAAYPNISVYYQGAWTSSGGTSAAAPIWAAGALLVDEALQAQGRSTIGGVPEFYELANHPGSHHPYNDITVGNNLFYNATSGWDYTTGWGSPNFNDIYQLELNL